MKRYLFFLIVLLSFCFNWNRVEAKSKTSREEKGCIGLDHNRFRYYDSNSGTYISKAPIGLAGNNPNLYAYVYDSNTMVDPFGLIIEKRSTNVIVTTAEATNASFPKEYEPPYKPGTKVTEFTTTTRGVCKSSW